MGLHHGFILRQVPVMALTWSGALLYTIGVRSDVTSVLWYAGALAAVAMLLYYLSMLNNR